MFDQSQQIMKNMDFDRENLFEGVEDIKLDISKSPHKEDFKQALDVWYFEESRFRPSWLDFSGLTLESSKRLILANFGEESVYGYSGLNAQALIQYSSLFELLIFLHVQERFLNKLSSVVAHRPFAETEIYKYFTLDIYGVLYLERPYCDKLFRKLKLLIK